MEAIQQAGILFHSGEWLKAEQICRQALSRQANDFHALSLLALIAIRTRRGAEAANLLQLAIAARPDEPATYNNYGNVLKELHRPEEALRSYRRALQLQPDYAEVHYNQGNLLRELHRADEALDSYRRAIEIRPNHAATHYSRALAFHDLGRLAEALDGFDHALTLKPDMHLALNNRGIVLQKLGRVDDALSSYAQALRIEPKFAEACYNEGAALRTLGRLDEAINSYARALHIKPDYPQALYNLGVTLQDLGRPEEALESYDRALGLRPEYPAALYNRGLAFHGLQRFEQALESYDRALSIEPDYPEVYNNRGNTLQQLRRIREALGSYDRAIGLNPELAEAHANRAGVLQELRRCEEALQGYARALQIKPDFAPGHCNLGNALRELKRFEDALASYAQGLQLEPNHRWLYGNWLHTKMQLCDWNELDEQVEQLLQRVGEGQAISLPFFLLAVTDSPAVQKQAARIWVREMIPADRAAPALGKHPRHDKIRLGYYSADFHGHATAHLAAELFERHDRDRFQLVAFSFGPPARDDAMRNRLAAAFDEFLDVGGRSDSEVARLSRELQIDIAVDLKGFTYGERNRIFAHRAAPVQVSYLGYPATLGAPYIDYLIADRTLIPARARVHYAEKIAYLPHSYQVNDRQRPIAERRFSRVELGLPPTGFVFCCFNNAYKITPAMFDSWMRILRQVEGSVLWLLQDSQRASENLWREAQARGVSAERLIFAGRMPLPEHLARHRAANLFLDTHPCNAHTTASDALWAGLPVLTRLGETFAARVAASLLNAVGLGELVATTAQQYETIAIQLALDGKKLDGITHRLNATRLQAPLFDTPSFTRHLEEAYSQMYERLQSGLPADHLFVAS